MKFGIFAKHGALNSEPVFVAFQQGLQKLGLEYKENDKDADVAVIWSMVWSGRMKKNQAVWQQFRESGRPVIVLEVGTLRRGHTWKMGVNGLGRDAFFGHGLDIQRPQNLSLNLLPWRSNGKHIVVAMQREDSEQWVGQPDMCIWLEKTVRTLRENSNREIVVRNHPRKNVQLPLNCRYQSPLSVPGTYDDYDFRDCIKHAWAVVNWNSGPGVQSVLSGVPVFVGPNSLASPMGNYDLTQIENPMMPDRARWLIDISHTEWMLHEISEGIPINRLLPYLEESVLSQRR